MNIIKEEIVINTKKEVELINITSKINEIISEKDIQDGLVNISTKHTTSAIIINEDESGLKKDIINLYEQIIPFDDYFHDKIDNNAKSHLKASLSTPNQTLPIINGKISLGVWQSIFFVEFDGPRKRRKILITIID
ncbi:secondary thiamine-phosphate synthase enzyme YjbQ [Methanosphaera sp. ISO3-F5]|uniref:secondary thiamine-phosphate synthase enzyme YjbQ n=1 Tax=Methanosphaera sp. ISO3-F5 TaxID=1452353 RepID=UPI002B259EEC|nr:secondary thiamine-phosphate synthase enzyme YjbQ [Methanosphaera sp. ISO3-F5]WQH63466.1 secondary thiamine-phosphate synthase enzyme YjbQ [Methanosphaera sp. ISO3-F5]